MRLLAYVLQLTVGLPICPAPYYTTHLLQKSTGSARQHDRSLHMPSRVGIITTVQQQLTRCLSGRPRLWNIPTHYNSAITAWRKKSSAIPTLSLASALHSTA